MITANPNLHILKKTKSPSKTPTIYTVARISTDNRPYLQNPLKFGQYANYGRSLPDVAKTYRVQNVDQETERNEEDRKTVEGTSRRSNYGHVEKQWLSKDNDSPVVKFLKTFHTKNKTK